MSQPHTLPPPTSNSISEMSTCDFSLESFRSYPVAPHFQQVYLEVRACSVADRSGHPWVLWCWLWTRPLPCPSLFFLRERPVWVRRDNSLPGFCFKGTGKSLDQCFCDIFRVQNSSNRAWMEFCALHPGAISLVVGCWLLTDIATSFSWENLQLF